MPAGAVPGLFAVGAGEGAEGAALAGGVAVAAELALAAWFAGLGDSPL